MKKIILILGLIVLVILLLNIDQIKFFFTRSIDLSGESIDSLKLGDNISSSIFIDKYQDYIYREEDNNSLTGFDMKYYEIKFNKENRTMISLGFLEKTGEIVYLNKSNYLNYEDPLETSVGNKGINIGDSIDKVIKIYGDNYYNYGYKDGGPKGIVYLDKENMIKLIFLESNKQVYWYSLEYFK